MKKILSALVLVSVLAVPMIASAIDEPAEMTGECSLSNDFSGWTKIECPSGGTCAFKSTTYDCPMCCLLDTVYNVTNWIFLGVLAIVVIMVLIGAFLILTAAGSPEKINSGRQYIIYAIVGAVIAALAKSIPAIVIAILHLA